jgi:dihydroxyacetone kinase
MKKIMNSAEAFVEEVLEGILLAHPDALRASDLNRHALVRTRMPAGQVGIVTGGGSGHLPLFLGYVGDGLCSGVAIGNVFSSPSIEEIVEAAKASDTGAGVLFLIGNYGGDVMNFSLAADLLELEGIETETVLGIDDVLSAPRERAQTRRGVAGLVLAYKCAGAAAARGDDLAGVAAAARHAVAGMRTAGVGLSPTILPTAGKPTFTLGPDEMEIGIGIHGEPGTRRGRLEPADRIADLLLAAVLAELEPAEGSQVAVLVNGMGATPPEELYLIFRHVHQVLGNRGVTIGRHWIGEYATSLEMAGASLTVMALDDELTSLLDAPSLSPFVRL